MRSKSTWVQPNARNPFCYQSGILPGGDSYVRSTATEEQKLTWLSPLCLDVSVNRFSGLLGHLEPDRLSSLLLTHGRAIEELSIWGDVLYPEVYDVAAA